jgi:ankyrin repeat protein
MRRCRQATECVLLANLSLVLITVVPYVLPQDGWTALMLACQKGHTAIAQALIGAKADLNVQNQVGGREASACL